MKEELFSTFSKDADNPLRPKTFNDFIGQKKTLDNLRIFIHAARERQEPLDHLLLYGPPGLGKTTIAHIIANEMGGSLKISSGPVMEKKADLAAIMTSLNPGDVLFIDEIHRMNRSVEECLYPALEDNVIDIILGEGPHANNIRLQLNPFTLVGATTRAGLLTTPLRDRFGIVSRLEFYDLEEMIQIIQRNAALLQIDITRDAAEEIGRRSRGTPRIANTLLRRVRDIAQVNKVTVIDCSVACESLAQLDIDENGLDHMTKLLLRTVLNKFEGGPVGLSTLAIALGEEPDTIEDVYEPYLIKEGYLMRTARGRVTTLKTVQIFKK